MEWITLSEGAQELGISVQRMGQLARDKTVRSKRRSLPGSKITLVYVSRKDVLARKANPPVPHRPRAAVAQ